MSERRTVSVRDIESLLVCLPGIQRARVVVNDWGAIEEIHILTGLGRNPKQIVRDVQSALKAQWDITVDRRKVSVAQIQTGLPEPSGRLRHSGLEIKADARTGKSEIIVTLDRAGDGQGPSYVGKTIADSAEASTLLGIAKATCLAGNLTLEPPNVFFVDDISITAVGQYQAVTVLLDLLTPRHNQEQIVGCALVKRDIREACVRATLDAMNRRMEVLPQKSATEPSEGPVPGSGQPAPPAQAGQPPTQAGQPARFAQPAQPVQPVLSPHSSQAARLEQPVPSPQPTQLRGESPPAHAGLEPVVAPAKKIDSLRRPGSNQDTEGREPGESVNDG